MIDELELSLKDMIMKILLRWRLIVISALIVGILAGMCGAFLERNKAIEAAIPKKEISLDEQVQALKAQLTKGDAYMVKVAVELNKYYIARQTYLTDYLQNSIRMQVDAGNVPTMKKMYQIYSDTLSEEVWNTVAKAYAWELDDTELYSLICSELELPEADMYAKELVIISQSTDGSFTVSVIANDEKQCEEIINVIDKKIEADYKEMKSIYGEFKVVELEESFQHEYNKTILTEQETVKGEFLKIKSKIPTLDDYFFEAQNKYYNILLSGYDENAVIEESEEVYAEESTEEVIVETELINKKYAILGAAAGFVMSIGYVAVMYIFSAKLRKKDDLQFVFGIPNVVSVRKQNPNKKFLVFIDKFIYWIFNGKETDEEKNAVDHVVANIKMVAQKKQMKNIYLVGTCDLPSVEEFREEVVAKIGSDLNVECGQFNEKRIDNLEKMIKSDVVFMFEETGLSKNKNIKRVVDVCQLNEINIGGSIIFDTY